MRRVALLAALLAITACSRSEYVYLYDCGGTISKFDLASKQKVGEWRAGDIAGLADVVPLPVRDGCTLNNARYEPASGQLAVVARLSPVVTDDPAQRYALLMIDLADMHVTAHVELPPSATIPVLVPPSGGEIVVGYEIPRDDEPNQTWVARYGTRTLELLGAPEQGAEVPTIEAERSLPPEIPAPDPFTDPVFTDR